MPALNTSWAQRIGLPEIRPSDTPIRVDHALIICAAGFEDRTLAFCSSLVLSRCRMGLAVYKDWAKDNLVTEIAAGYVAAGLSPNQISHFEYDRFNPDVFAGELELWLTSALEPRVIVDISTMSRLAIMIVLDACRTSGKEVLVFYAEAQDYGPTLREYEDARLGLYPRPSVQVYSGLGGVVRSSRLSSVALQGEPTALIAFMSMNEVLTQALINCICPSRLFLINGRPPNHRWREEATAWIHDELRREWPVADNPVSSSSDGPHLPTRVTSTLNYTESLGVLLDLYWDCAAEFRIVLAPTGSKMQTLACFLAKALHTDIHIEYPTPESFLKEYSKGVGSRWLVDFGRLQDRVAEWRSIIMRDRLMIAVGMQN